MQVKRGENVRGSRYPIAATCGSRRCEHAACGVRRELAKHNRHVLESRYAPEWQFQPATPDGPPGLALALSGGGMRSAAFCTGVMQAMSADGVLAKVDVLSSVSGGSYAASWYVLQHAYEVRAARDGGPAIDREAFDRMLFDNDGRFQRHLLHHGRVMTQGHAWGCRYYVATAGWIAASVGLLAPVNVLLNGVFGMHVNTTPIRWAYQQGIERAFHLRPSEDGCGRYENACEVPFVHTFGVDRATEFTELRSVGPARGLPFLIVNTTANIDDDLEHHNSKLTNTIFEFTPWWFGSDAFGHCPDAEEYPLSVNRAVAVSGAAPDSNIAPGAGRRLLTSAFNLDTGYYIPNHARRPSLWWKAIPLVYMFLPHYQRDANGSDIYLTDGGHSENLGAFSLIRRMAETIVIVDAEHDPELQFGAFKRLRERVRAELGVELTVSAIDRVIDGGETFCGADVLEGSIRYLPYLDDSGCVRDVELKVLYVKLRLDRGHIGQYPLTVRKYALENDDFPQESTCDQDFSPSQFRAYRDLGNHIGRRLADKLIPSTSAPYEGEQR